MTSFAPNKRYPDAETSAFSLASTGTAFRIRISFILLLLPGILSAQNTNATGMPPASRSIYNVFNEEMEKYTPSANNGKPLKPLRSILPATWNKFPASTSDTIYMMGISDPGLPLDVATGQALLRASGLAALARGCRGEHFSDFFQRSNTDKADSRFEEIYQITATTINQSASATVHRSFRLKSGEQLVIAAIPANIPRDKKDTILPHGYLYQYDASFGGTMQIIRRVSYITSGTLQADQIISPDTVSFYLVNKRFTGIRNLQKKISPEMSFDYYYLCPGQSQHDTSLKYSGSTCRSGLWIAMLDQIWDQLSLYLKSHSAQTRKVQDYNPALSNELNRETNGLNLKFNIEHISLSDNELMVKTDVTHEK